MIDTSLRAFVAACAAKTPTPGGGAASALFASVGAALGAMAARFTAGKKGFEAHADELNAAVAAFDALHERLLPLVQQDCDAYDRVSAALALPKSDDAQKAARSAALQAALRGAMEVPLTGARACAEGLERIAAIASRLNPNLVSDAGVCTLALHAAFQGLAMNVRINASSLKDEAAKGAALAELEALAVRARSAHQAAMQDVEKALAGSP